MAVDLINLSDWIFRNNEEGLDSFFSEVFKNNLKASDKCKIRDVEELNKIDTEYIKREYKYTSMKPIEDLKSDVKTNYINNNFCLKYHNWYIVKPLGLRGCDSYRTFFSVFLPDKAMDKVKQSFIDYSKPCFSCNYIQLIDMTDGKQSILFIGGLDEPEPSCKCGEDHKWMWDIYRDDCLEVYFAECEKCGIKRKKIIGDDRNYQWNKNQGWRYFDPSQVREYY